MAFNVNQESEAQAPHLRFQKVVGGRKNDERDSGMRRMITSFTVHYVGR